MSLDKIIDALASIAALDPRVAPNVLALKSAIEAGDDSQLDDVLSRLRAQADELGLAS